MSTQNYTNYFRITVYHAGENLSIIFDSFGMYEKLWQFSSHFVKRGFEICAISCAENFLDGDIKKDEYLPDNIMLRANHTGRPEIVNYEHNGTVYRAIQVEGKVYVPDKTRRA